MADILIDGVRYTSDNSKTPYTDIYNAYAQSRQQSLANQQQLLANQLASSKASTNRNYDSNAAQAYINYIKQRNSMPEQLRAQGINGGASESVMARVANNYAQNTANNNSSRSSALSELQNAYNTNLANLNQSFDDDLAAQRLALAQAQAQYTDTLNQRALEQFSATLERFTSVGAVDKAIKALDPEDVNYNAMLQLLQLRRAQLKTGSGGGGSRRSSGGSYSGGGSTVSSSTTSSIANTAVNNVLRGIAASLNKNKTSSNKNTQPTNKYRTAASSKNTKKTSKGRNRRSISRGNGLIY